MFRSVLVANRGEIAVRVIRAAQELGVRAVAVYSEADRAALHVRLADEAVAIGPAPAAESYLSIDRILDAARMSGAEALHPGYGFLSENPEFAEACLAAGLAFIGPPPDAMRLLGDKILANQAMEAAGVPVLPGYHGGKQDNATLARAARKIGFPLLVKAAAGGGGRGMRRVDTLADLREAFASARREAESAFGDNRLLLERLLEDARHIEVQVLCDDHGTVRHVGERECSVQRRHQKVIEEAPSPIVEPPLRTALGEAAERVMRTAGYRGAGTVEFLLGPDRCFYFMEVNARLQVEHPVTEVAWGVDLVKLQFELAAGANLADLPAEPRAHTIECRLYAEDARHHYTPSTGRLVAFFPPLGPNLRHDVGVEAGSQVTSYYDPLLAKLIAWGSDRPAALAAARWALDHYRVIGVTTNQPQLQFVLNDPEFAAQGVTIDFLDRAWQFVDDHAPPEAFAAAAAYALAQRPDQTCSPWPGGASWRLGGQGIPFRYEREAETVDVRASRLGASWRIEVAGGTTVESAAVGATFIAEGAVTDHVVSLVTEDGDIVQAAVSEQPDGILVQLVMGDFLLRAAGPPDPVAAAATTLSAGQQGLKQVEAPMPGRLVKINVAEGDRVRLQQPLVIMEAMKIEHIVAAPRNAVVRRVLRRIGDQVERGAALIELEEP